MAKVKEGLPMSEPDYDHRIEMRRKEGSMRMSHVLPMGKNRKDTEKRVREMIDKMFGQVK